MAEYHHPGFHHRIKAYKGLDIVFPYFFRSVRSLEDFFERRNCKLIFKDEDEFIHVYVYDMDGEELLAIYRL